MTLGQVEIGEKTNEIPMFSTLLDTIDDLAEVIVTADALHAQHEHATYLHRRGAHYVLTIKGNQQSLRRQLASQPWTDVPVGHRETDTSHGRRATRTYKVITIATGIGFPHAAQAVQITRTRKPKSKRKVSATRETVYAITSLTAQQAPPAELARYIRGHWHVENKLHWRHHHGRRRLQDHHRRRPPHHGRTPQPRNQPAPPRRTHQHRQSTTPQRTQTKTSHHTHPDQLTPDFASALGDE
ncbi:ISAs1 family transposase [Actinophytocola sp.]|uniref:ISAs1 family transposase n=1 Tax=Actinophytocola sp. TaxID=1872138 RepID=UPI00389AB59C